MTTKKHPILTLADNAYDLATKAVAELEAAIHRAKDEGRDAIVDELGEMMRAIEEAKDRLNSVASLDALESEPYYDSLKTRAPRNSDEWSRQ
jgi:hypothetical protein